MWSSKNSHSLLVEMQNGTVTLEDSLVVSHKTEYTLIIWSSNYSPWYLPKGVENLCPQRNLNMDVNSSFIHNCQNLEITKTSFSGEWINKLKFIQAVEY